MPNNNFTGGCSGEDRGGCDHLCFQALVDPVTGTSVTRCSCYRGFRLDPADGKSCLGMRISVSFFLRVHIEGKKDYSLLLSVLTPAINRRSFFNILGTSQDGENP